MSSITSLQAEFSDQFLKLTVFLEEVNSSENPPSVENFVKIQVCWKNLERAHSALQGKTDPLIKSAFSLSSEKTQKFTRIFLNAWMETHHKDVPLPSQLKVSLFAEKTGCFLFGCGNNSPEELACLELDFPHAFEFGGVVYPSARHAFLAQTFPGKRGLQEQCAKASLEALPRILLTNGNHHSEWYKPTAIYSQQQREAIMYHITDAKFGQSPELLKTLIATLDATLIFTSDIDKKEAFWEGGPRGNRSNKLGQILMRIREKYQGIGISAPSKKCLESLQVPSIKTGVLSLDKSDAEIEAEISALNASASNEVYCAETKICKLPENRHKNRFNDYNYVFDKSLVPLSTGRYINANFLHSASFIGSQTPMQNTAEDFWQMVLDQKSKSVVMLNLPSDFVHFFYCPDSTSHPKQFGSIKVRLLKEATVETDPSWYQAPFEEEPHAIKTRSLEIQQGDLVHQTTHYQYLNWRDLKVGSEGCVSRLVRKVNQDQGDNPTPIVVHCLAGVGRTAAFAAIYDQYRKWKDGEKINISKSVAEQRDPKEGRFYKMVQSHDQYAFIYSTLRHMIINN